MKVTQQKITANLKMCHTSSKSPKDETFLNLSKLFSKTPVSNSTSKHTISATPAMRLVVHHQGSSLSHGSFEELSNTLRQDRRQVARKDNLTRQGRESLHMAHSHFCETWGSSPDPQLLSVWEHYRKSSTVNQYANPWLKWVEYSEKAGSQPIPANPFLFATWLAGASLSDTTASPTETRCAAIAFFSKAALSTSPTSHQVVKMTRESIVRKLGFKKMSKNPLLKEHVNQIVQYFLQRNTVQDQANTFRVALAYEATLRWDDFADTLFGDFIVTHDFVRVFLVDTKTDNCKSGQWATFSASSTETSAYTLLQNLVKNILSDAPAQSLNNINLANFPIMFKSLQGSENADKIPKITYNEFLKELKTACAAIGLDPALFATHSLRRGSVSDQFWNGIPDKVIKYSGRWKSNAFETYIDHTVLLELQLKTIQPQK